MAITNDCIPSTIPDLCIAYQLHTECGTMINLYDWMQVSCTYEHACWHCMTLYTVLFSNSQSSKRKSWEEAINETIKE